MLGLGLGLANLNPSPNPNANANPNPDPNPNQVLVIAGCGCGALSALVSCAVLWTMLRRGLTLTLTLTLSPTLPLTLTPTITLSAVLWATGEVSTPLAGRWRCVRRALPSGTDGHTAKFQRGQSPDCANSTVSAQCESAFSLVSCPQCVPVCLYE